MRVKLFAAACLLAMTLTACHRQPRSTAYTVEGTVAQIYPGEARIQIAHDKIPGYMEAMTMDFNAKEAGALSGLQPGDRVRFDLIITRERGWIENVRRVGKATSRPAPTLAKLWTPPLKAGELIPDVAFTNELGRAVRLSDYRGEALAITFIFTRCPFPDFCPRMSRQMGKVNDTLNYIPNAPTNWHLFSISFDPEYDQPNVLREYRKNLNIENNGRWQFLTGAPGEIKRFCGAFGVYFVRDRGSIDHNLVTAVIDTQGRVQRLFPGNKWSPDDLIDELANAAALPQPRTLVAR